MKKDNKIKEEIDNLLIKLKTDELNKRAVSSVQEQEIYDAVRIIVKYLNITSGSIKGFNLYNLLNKYFRFPEERDKINKIIGEKE